VLLDTGCTVGFLGRAFLRLYESELDDQYAKILSLKKESRFIAERDDGCKNGGLAVAEMFELNLEPDLNNDLFKHYVCVTSPQ
jgi:hypothetical protein